MKTNTITYCNIDFSFDFDIILRITSETHSYAHIIDNTTENLMPDTQTDPLTFHDPELYLN